MCAAGCASSDGRIRIDGFEVADFPVLSSPVSKVSRIGASFLDYNLTGLTPGRILQIERTCKHDDDRLGFLRFGCGCRLGPDSGYRAASAVLTYWGAIMGKWDLLPIDHPTYHRRVVREVNRSTMFGAGSVYVALCSGEKRRVVRARYRGGVDVQTLGSAVWFPVNPEALEGVSASRTVCGC
jgi:hypothetical protein